MKNILLALAFALASFGAQADTIKINAHADICCGGAIGPSATLWVNGVKTEVMIVTNTVDADLTYATTAALPPGTLIDIVFSNDVSQGSISRTLYLNSLTVTNASGTVTMLPTGSGVTYDRGNGADAFNGLSVIPGQVAMAVNGAMRFPALPPAGPSAWLKVSNENEPFALPAAMTVRYGANNAFVQQSFPAGAGQCTSWVFGGADPAPGWIKRCEALVPAGATAPTPNVEPTQPALPAGTWAKVANDNATYTVSGLRVLRYGAAAEGWYMMQDSGTGTCSAYYFGRNPAPNSTRTCEVFTPTASTVATTAPGGGPKIDVSKIPPGDPGYGVDLIRATTDLGNGPGDSGDFRTSCKFTHMAFDDPITKPGQPGASHLHMFFGNAGINANSTAASIANSGYSTCGGGASNRTGYWVPAMIDTLNGTPVAPTGTDAGNGVYYKTGYDGTVPSKTKAFPPGLRMIAGDMMNATPNGPFQFSCYVEGTGNISVGRSIPNCPVNSKLEMDVYFPQCWDGVNLDSPDHKSHMAYSVGADAWSAGGCPATHPVQLPTITFRTMFNVKEANSTSRWRLSSDMYSATMPAGYSAHGDWWNGWKPPVLSKWIANCSVKSMDCHFNLLGDGTELFTP